MDVNAPHGTNEQWIVHYNKREIGFGSNQMQALHRAYTYLRENNITPAAGELNIVVNILGSI